MGIDRPIKRQRKTLSCTFCKKRKVKCDKEKPCSSCIRYGAAHLCSYQIEDEKDKLDSPPQEDTTVDIADRVNKRTRRNSSVSSEGDNRASELQFLKQKIEELENKDNINTFDEEKFNEEPYENQADYLNSLGRNIHSSSNDKINFHKDYTPIQVKKSLRRINLGPFAWFSLVKKDIASKALFRAVSILRQRKEMGFRAPYAEKEVSTGMYDLEIETTSFEVQNIDKHELNADFREKELDNEGFNDMKPLKSTRKTQFQDRSAVNKSGIALGLALFEGTLDDQYTLIEKIKLVLPKQKALWLLIKRFFVHVYPFFPIIDQEYFKETVEKMIGKENYLDIPVDDLRIEKKLDFANAAILLLVARTTYLSLFSNRLVINEKNLLSTPLTDEAQEVKYLLSNPMNVDVVQIAQLCLDQFDVLGKNNIVIIQCSLLMRLYRMFAPEYGDGADGGDSQIYNGMLVQMAYSMGLNREPGHHLEVLKDQKINNIGRKIWLFLVLTDVVQAIQYGNPLSIEPKYSDTKLPYLEGGNENIKDAELEKIVLGGFSYFKRFYVKIRRILDLTLPVNSTVAVKELVHLLNDFELFVYKNYGSLNDYFEPFQAELYHYPFVKIMKCKNFLTLRNFNITMLFHLFLYFEKKGNSRISFFYFIKVFHLIYEGFVPYLHDLVYNNQVSFGDSAGLIMNPVIQNTMHKALQILLSILVRVIISIELMTKQNNSSPEMNNDKFFVNRLKNLESLKSHLLKAIRIIFSSLMQLSRRYYYSWKICKANSFLMSQLDSSEFRKALASELSDSILVLSDSQIDVMLAISQKAASLINGRLYRARYENHNTVNPPRMDNIPSTLSPGPSSIGTSNFGDDLFAYDEAFTGTSNSSLGEKEQFMSNFLETDIDKLWSEIENVKQSGVESFDFDLGRVDGINDAWPQSSGDDNFLNGEETSSGGLDFLSMHEPGDFDFYKPI